MSETLESIRAFIQYGRSLSGYEKGEAQVFCDRLFQAFGYEGYKEAGASLESQIKPDEKATKFIDLIWRPRLVLEMKSRGVKLQKHYQQAFDYWLNATPDRPQYVILCNFDEFWVYDFNFQLHEPVDRLGLEDLQDRYTALNFLFPDKRKPIFNNDRVAVTRAAACTAPERVSAWGLAGTGAGRLTLDLDGGPSERYGADLAMTLAAMGVRGELVTPAEAGSGAEHGVGVHAAMRW